MNCSTLMTIKERFGVTGIREAVKQLLGKSIPIVSIAVLALTTSVPC